LVRACKDRTTTPDGGGGGGIKGGEGEFTALISEQKVQFRHLLLRGMGWGKTLETVNHACRDRNGKGSQGYLSRSRGERTDIATRARIIAVRSSWLTEWGARILEPIDYRRGKPGECFQKASETARKNEEKKWGPLSKE